MALQATIATIESSRTIDELKTNLQKIIENYGFSSFAFVDVGHPELDAPFVLATNDPAWDREYRANGFIHVDPMIPIVRRTNVPFHWGQVPIPQAKGRRKPGGLKTMEAAWDHGFTEGFVIPVHYVDKIGRKNSASCVLFWKDKRSRFTFALKHKRAELHLLLVYWVQRLIDIAAEEASRRRRYDPDKELRADAASLTDRERHVLSWAGRGKTTSETATILRISDETVETHVRNAMQKLQASNRTHAVAIALHLGLIDV